MIKVAIFMFGILAGITLAGAAISYNQHHVITPTEIQSELDRIIDQIDEVRRDLKIHKDYWPPQP
jgi:uncharacterized membrane-anchored protein YhcB (DUF1043 family)